MQITSFAELLEKYQDYDTSLANESYNNVLFRFNRPETTYYFISADNNRVGIIRVVDSKGKYRKRISLVFILLANEGINIQKISRRLGHSNVEMTWNTFSHLYPREEERAVAILNRIEYIDVF